MGHGTQFRHGNAALSWLQKFMRNAPHSNAYWLEAQYNRFLGIENTGELGACSMPTGTQ